MDEEIKSKIAESLNALMGYVEQGAEFAIEEAPLVAQEIIRWGIVGNVVDSLLCVAFFMCLWLAIHCMTHGNVEEPDPDTGASPWTPKDARVISFLAASACAGVAVWIAGDSIVLALKAVVAPRLFVLGQISELVK